MCDTLLALRTVTLNGSTLLAKNSDREPDEAQSILMVPAQHHPSGGLRATFIDIPQVARTYSCILSKPFQMWGAEMGVNEHGLAIGNEAVFTNVEIKKTNTGLTGMDLLRLALERCKSTDEAINCITGLLEQYGQDACGGYRNKGFYYHNSFLITDGNKGAVLETAGRHWAVEWVQDRRSISNRLSIRKPDLSSSDEIEDFTAGYSDWLYTTVGRAATRQQCTTGKMDESRGKLTAAHCMQTLQTHNLPDESFKPGKATTGSVCMHATSFLNPSQTTGSMVVELRKSMPSTVWLTGTSMPCLSLYVPYFFQTDTLNSLVQPTASSDDSLWWEAERLHRWICKDYPSRRASIVMERSAIQSRFLEAEARLMADGPSLPELEKFSNECLREAMAAIRRWHALIPSK